MLEIKDKSKITGFAWHHFGGFRNTPWASTQKLDERRIENAHAAEWPKFTSDINGSHIGYTFIIWADGSYNQYRYIGEKTAAVQGFNDELISGCIAGNFSLVNGKPVDEPTPAQIETAQKISAWVHENISIPINRFKPHRYWGHTKCYGDALDDAFTRRLFTPYLKKRIGLLTALVMAYQKLLILRNKRKPIPLGKVTDFRECEGSLKVIEYK